MDSESDIEHTEEEMSEEEEQESAEEEMEAEDRVSYRKHPQNSPFSNVVYILGQNPVRAKRHVV